jgi:hypothetical protein
MSTSTDIATIEPSSYLALNRESSEIQEIIRDNLAGQDVGEFDLPRIKIPAGGGTTWEIESPLHGTQSERELQGIVVYHRQTRSFWRDDDSTGTPPDCSSRDGVVGVGDPGGECRTCPLSQFGSDGGRGQACKQQAMWFLLREDSFLPVVLSLPPTSLKAAKQYMLALAGAGIRAAEVVTKITLEKQRNPDGQDYSRAVLSVGGKLDEAATARARAYAEQLRPVFDATPAEPGEPPAATASGGKTPPPAAPAAPAAAADPEG